MKWQYKFQKAVFGKNIFKHQSTFFFLVFFMSHMFSKHSRHQHHLSQHESTGGKKKIMIIRVSKRWRHLTERAGNAKAPQSQSNGTLLYRSLLEWEGGGYAQFKASNTTGTITIQSKNAKTILTELNRGEVSTQYCIHPPGAEAAAGTQ